MWPAPPTLNVPLGAGPRSNISPSKLEWETLPLNSRNRVRRGQILLLPSLSRKAPVGCCGKAIQKPIASDPAATLSRYTLSGLVIQNDDAVLSDGIRILSDFWPALDWWAMVRLVGSH